MVVEPYLAGLVPDIMLVPVGISYQRTLEELLFSRELLGVPKPPESTRVSVCLIPHSMKYLWRKFPHILSRNLLLSKYFVPVKTVSLQGLMKALSMISEDYGSIFVEFCQPISLHDFCTSRGVSRIPHTSYPKSVNSSG